VKWITFTHHPTPFLSSFVWSLCSYTRVEGYHKPHQSLCVLLISLFIGYIPTTAMPPYIYPKSFFHYSDRYRIVRHFILLLCTSLFQPSFASVLIVYPHQNPLFRRGCTPFMRLALCSTATQLLTTNQGRMQAAVCRPLNLSRVGEIDTNHPRPRRQAIELRRLRDTRRKRLPVSYFVICLSFLGSQRNSSQHQGA